MKQTAVEWLVRTLNENIEFIPLDKWDEIRDVVQQALAMEKEQIMDAYLDGCNDIRQDKYMGMHEYYNETYKGGKDA